jgi:glycosyltransferase involved in cell wall biosynthesis
MHVLFSTPAFSPFHGGGERYAAALAACLARKGHRVTVVTSAATVETHLWQGAGEMVLSESVDPNITVIRAPLRPFPGNRNALLAWRKSMVLASALPGSTPLLKWMSRMIPPICLDNQVSSLIREPVDIVHGFNISWEYAALWGWRFAREHGVPFVISPFAHLGTGPKDRVAFNSTMRHQLTMLDDADAVLALTAVEAQGLQGRGVRAPMMAVGSGLDNLPDMPTEVAIEPELRPYVLFVGRASYDKGALHAAQAVVKLRARGTAVRLVMIGRETEAFEQFQQSLSPVEREAIVWVGPADDAQKHAYLGEAEALLLPSHSDSFGIVLLEAWAHGKPVVAAAAGGIPGVVDADVNGLLVPFGDVEALAGAIQRLLDQPALARELGENGRRKVADTYQWDKVTDAVLAAYDAALRTRQKPYAPDSASLR